MMKFALTSFVLAQIYTTFNIFIKEDGKQEIITKRHS